MTEYGFTEGTDFTVTDIFVHNPAGGLQSKKKIFEFRKEVRA